MRVIVRDRQTRDALRARRKRGNGWGRCVRNANGGNGGVICIVVGVGFKNDTFLESSGAPFVEYNVTRFKELSRQSVHEVEGTMLL